MIDILEAARIGTLRRAPFFMHIATVLAAMSELRGDSWKVAVTKFIFLMAKLFVVFLFEISKSYRRHLNKYFLSSRQMWRVFFLVAAILFVIYIAASVLFSMRTKNPNGLGLFFSLYLTSLATPALLLYWELKDEG
ncbi:hypothetical protein [Paraburkholderia bannensis]|uniref:hypothetical protein n=1 Tax=Paraburkholderia bannensis TaxID=765414 RepID=UPI002AB6F59F|nr:hypothetical protein [Paraburkholderia bannensis]